MGRKINNLVNHPSHYTQGKIECIDVILDQDMTFCAASALQYLWRYRHKGTPILDLEKCKWYIDREIQRITEDIANAENPGKIAGKKTKTR